MKHFSTTTIKPLSKRQQIQQKLLRVSAILSRLVAFWVHKMHHCILPSAYGAQDG
jgi:hypothetical protein